MNICFYSREYPPETGGGGIGTYVHNTAHALSSMGHTVTVISQWLDDYKEYDDKDVHVIRLKSPTSSFGFISGKRLVKTGERLSRSWLVYQTLKSLKVRPDIIETPDFFAEGYITTLMEKIPVVTKFHTPLRVLHEISGVPMGRDHRMADYLERSTAIRSIGLHTYSEILRDKIVRLWGIDKEKIRLIPNGMDIERLRMIAKNIEAPPMTEEYVLFLGRVEDRKGARVLADALPDVLELHPNLRIVFVGGVDLNGEMASYILQRNEKFKNNIIFKGMIAEEEKIAFIKHAKFVLTPSLFEAFGYTTIESMALGKAVITTKGGAFQESFADGVTCHFIEPGNVAQLKDKMLWCLTHDNKVIERNAWEKTSLFDIKNIGKMIESYYKELVLQSEK